MESRLRTENAEQPIPPILLRWVSRVAKCAQQSFTRLGLEFVGEDSPLGLVLRDGDHDLTQLPQFRRRSGTMRQAAIDRIEHHFRIGVIHNDEMLVRIMVPVPQLSPLVTELVQQRVVVGLSRGINRVRQ